jgi:hypothetical protein
MKIRTRFPLGGYGLRVALVVASCALATASYASPVSVVFDELPNEEGISVSAVGRDGSVFAPVAVTGERALVAGGCCGAGLNPDIGGVQGLGLFAQQGGSHHGELTTRIDIFEPDGITLSDQLLFANRGSDTGFSPSWLFLSDPASFDLSTYVNYASIVEDGSLQLGYSYQNDKSDVVSVSFRSDVEVPEPGTLPLMAAALAAFAFVSRKLIRKPRAAV